MLTRTVANLPAEITHLYEEMQAKDQKIQELRAAISQRDGSLQKFIKLNGSLVQNPKEEPYSKVILQNYERAQILQEEKIGLSEKAAALVSCLSIDLAFSSLRYDSWIGT
jgi:inhibitor of growth protein 3